MKANRIDQLTNTFLREKNETNKFSPQVKGEKLTLAAGVLEGRFAVLVIGPLNDLPVQSTSLIRVSRYKVGGKDSLVFSLMEESLLDIFVSFTADLESIIQNDPKVSMNEIYNRYLYWQKMFKVEKSSVSEEKIKGLLIELYILDKFLIPKYGIAEANRGWTGSHGTHKDFSFADYWYEVKAVNLGKETIDISSAEQLESETDGQLLVTSIESTSSENLNGLNLYDLLNKLKSQMELEDQIVDFYSKIIELGFDLEVFTEKDSEVNQRRYVIHKTDSFIVNSDFPLVKSTMLPDSVAKFRYQLLISKIQDFKIEFQ